MLLVGIFVFRVPFQGSFVLLYLAMTVFLAAVIGVGLFISSLATTQQQGFLGAFVFMVPAILLSGFATPIENMPEWLQTLTLANPLRYYLAIIKGVFLKGMPATIVLQLLWPLAVIAVVTLSAATLAVPASGRVRRSRQFGCRRRLPVTLAFSAYWGEGDQLPCAFRLRKITARLIVLLN